VPLELASARCDYMVLRTRPSPATMLVWLGVAIGAVFGYLAVRDIRLAEVWDSLAACNYWWLLPALALVALGTLIRAQRWRCLFVPETRPALAPAFKATLIGLFFNSILPARAGEAARIVALNQDAQTSRAEATGTVVVERAMDVLCVLVLLFVLVPWLPDVTWLHAAAILAISLSAGIVAAVLLVAYLSARPLSWPFRMLGRLPFVSPERARQAGLNAVRGMAALRRPRLAVTALVWTSISWIVFGFSYWLVMRGLDLGLSPIAGLLVMVTTALAMILPSPPAAVGVFEAAAILALTAYGVPDSQALSYAVLLHALNFFPYLVAGLVILQSQALTYRRTGGRLTVER
jgi:uncharacterized membrane protein YbhN (UPF0104 family)